MQAFLDSRPIDPRSYSVFDHFCRQQGWQPYDKTTFVYNIEHFIGPDPDPPRPARAAKAAPRRARTDQVPTPPRMVSARLKEFPAEVHARTLLARIEETRDPDVDGILRTPEIQEIYATLCEDLGWRPRPWNPVAHQFTQLTTGAKVYDNVLLADGRIHKLRVYPVSTPSRQLDTPRNELPAQDETPVRAPSRRAA